MLSPTTQQPPGDPVKDGERPSLARRLSARSAHARLSSSLRLSTPLGVRARLNSIGCDSIHRQSKDSSSSTLTLQATKNVVSPIKANDSPYNSDSESDDDQEREDAEEKIREEQEALDQKLKRLQSVLTADALGLVRTVGPNSKGETSGARPGGTKVSELAVPFATECGQERSQESQRKRKFNHQLTSRIYSVHSITLV